MKRTELSKPHNLPNNRSLTFIHQRPDLVRITHSLTLPRPHIHIYPTMVFYELFCISRTRLVEVQNIFLLGLQDGSDRHTNRIMRINNQLRSEGRSGRGRVSRLGPGPSGVEQVCRELDRLVLLKGGGGVTSASECLCFRNAMKGKGTSGGCQSDHRSIIQ